MKKLFTLFLLLACLIFQQVNAQQIRYVTSTGSGGGTSWGDAAGDLQAVIFLSSPGDTVWVAAGTYTPSGLYFVMKNGVVVLGGFNGTETTAAMRNWKTNVTALTNTGSDAVIVNNNIDSTAVLDGFQFNNIYNGSYDIAGIHNTLASPTISNCVFNSNNTNSSGGGVDMANENGSSPKVTNCMFINAYGVIGFSPSILNDASSPVFTNCVFANMGGGGIISQNSSSVTITNCTFKSAPLVNYSSFYNITNCVFENSGFSGIYDDGSINITYSYTGSSTPGTGNILLSADPFVNSSNPLGDDGIWMTADDGLALTNSYKDAGTPDTTGLNLPVTDITGVARIQGDRIDMGAYESVLTAATWYVDNTATGGANNGSTWANAFLKLEDAIAVANDGDSIFVAKGTYNTPLGGSFAMKEGVKIYGGFIGSETNLAERVLIPMADNGTVLTGNDLARVIDNYQNGLTAAAVLDGFTITHGSAYQGGGISNNEASPTLNNLYITNNAATATSGGGIYNEDASPTISNTVISDNTAIIEGGGMANYFASDVHLKNVVVSGNNPSGIASNYSRYDEYYFPTVEGGIPSLYLDSVTVRNNTTWGIEFSGGDTSLLQIQHSTIAQNTGGGINCYAGDILGNSVADNSILNIDSSTFSENTGSALNVPGITKVNITHSLITENNVTAANHVIDLGNDVRNITIDHCIFSQNASPNGSLIYSSSGFLIDGGENGVICNISNTTINDNTSGGYLFWIQPNVKLYSVLFTQNILPAAIIIGTQSGRLSIYNCTIADNTSIEVTANAQNLTEFYNSVIYNNSATASFANAVYYSHCIADKTADKMVFFQTNNWDVDPLFVGGGNYHLQPNSAAINAGIADTTGSGLPVTDLAGNARIYQGRIDIGAYEDTSSMQQTNGTLYVKKNGAGNLSGDSWANALPEVGGALYYATTHPDSVKQLWVAGGTYNPIYKAGNGTDDADRSFVLRDSLSIYGGFSGNETDLSQRDLSNTGNASILSGDINSDDNGGFANTSDNVEITVISPGNHSNAILNGFTITGGSSDQSTFSYVNGYQIFQCSGGGSYLSESSPTLSDLIITNNLATESGGGIFGYESSPAISNVTVNNNSASNGGGLAFQSNSSPVLHNVTITNNTASVDGGGMYNVQNSNAILDSVTITGNTADGNGGGMANELGASPVLNNVTISNNTAGGGGGGGVYNYTSFPTFSRTIISGNESKNGAGIYNGNGSSTILISSSIAGNYANKDGGGVENEQSVLTLRNVTVAGNYSADAGGGGIYNNGTEPTLYLTNTIIAGNSDDGLFGNLGDVTITYSLIQGMGADAINNNLDGTTIMASDIFMSPQDNTNAPTILGNYSLKSTSPVIDLGTADTTGLNLPANDLAGVARVLGGRIDIGAYEYSGVLPLTLVAFNGNASGNAVSLNWQTTAEINTDRFVIERSADGKQFNAIGTTKAIGTGANKYPYTDNAPLPVGYYRLRIVDNNGTVKYSKIIVITLGNTASCIIFPNPAKDVLHITTNNSLLIGSVAILYNANGSALQKVQLSSNTPVSLKSYAAGNYFLKVNTGETFKIIVAQ